MNEIFKKWLQGQLIPYTTITIGDESFMVESVNDNDITFSDGTTIELMLGESDLEPA